MLRADLFFVTHDSPDEAALLKTIKLIKENSKKGVILDCPDEKALKAGLALVAHDRPAIHLDYVRFGINPGALHGDQLAIHANPARRDEILAPSS